jgi:hypothetical protein
MRADRELGCAVYTSRRGRRNRRADAMQLLNKRGLVAKIDGSEALASESLEQGGQWTSHKWSVLRPSPPLGYLPTRYLCRRLRTEYPDLRLVGAILTERDVEDIKKRQPPVTRADDLASSLKTSGGTKSWLWLLLEPTRRNRLPPVLPNECRESDVEKNSRTRSHSAKEAGLHYISDGIPVQT